jgi:predicted dehydrogenase
MDQHQADRRKFLKEAAAAAAGVAGLSSLPRYLFAKEHSHVREVNDHHAPSTKVTVPKILFSVIGINHGHIFSQAQTVINAGGEFVSFYAKEPDLSAQFLKTFPDVKVARSEQEILEDKNIHLVVSAAIPDERAALGIRVMKHGKDFMADKPGITTLQQLKEVRKVQKETGRIYSILYGERIENKATIKAAELVKAGAIGKVIQTIGLGPHRMNASSRPAWFFDTKRYGGIITDIASHQFDQFLYFTGARKPEVVAAQVGNVNHKQYPLFEDFGDVMLRSEKGTGYIRVDWFTPDGLKTWGDARLTVLGTEGYIEVRKNIDLAGRDGGNHLFLVNQKETVYVDSSKAEVVYGKQLVEDILNRTETAMSQEHCFLAAELSIIAQKQAKKINII